MLSIYDSLVITNAIPHNVDNNKNSKVKENKQTKKSLFVKKIRINYFNVVEGSI